jgi:two-component system sensor histidine kinase KdpD
VALDVGAQWVELQGDDVAATLMDFARRTQITQIVLGASRRSRWSEFWSGGSVVWKVQRLAAIENVDVHIIARIALPEFAAASDRAAGRGKGEVAAD